MTTAADRLVQLSGASGAAAALLLAIGAGATSGEALVDYSGLSEATASAHILADHLAPDEHVIYSGAAFPIGSSDGLIRIRRTRRRRESDLLFMGN